MFILSFFILLFLGPRFLTVTWWLLQPARFNLAFGNIFIPILGIIFLPWTTLMYIIVSPGGLNGFDWFWLGLMLFADLSSYAGGAFKGKQQMSSKSQPKTETPSTSPTTKE